MEALRFTLKGRTGFFKIPEVNTYYYFTYGNIHKVALLGIFGAILGYKGYSSKYNEFPEFYERLLNLRISVIPNTKSGYFQRKIHIFNNSVGYASKEKGGNLIIKEQWLENPSWAIYVLLDTEESKTLAYSILNNKCVYIPYLGKNDHIAEILNPKKINLTLEEGLEFSLSSLAIYEGALEADFDEMTYKYEEYLPYGLDCDTNQYILKKFILTDAPIIKSSLEVYCDEARRIVFY